MSNTAIASLHRNALVIRFDQPEMRNPLSMTVLDVIENILEEINEQTERIVFTGTGGVFASGADLREIAEIDGEMARPFARRGQGLMLKIAMLPQETVAFINGACYGGALDLALACDRRIALRKATFCHPGTGLGIITGWGGTQRLPRLIGEANALEMFFTASPIDAERAYEIGLVDEVVGSVDERMKNLIAHGL